MGDALNKQFPHDTNGDAYFAQATSYFDNDDVNNLKVVFLVYQENTKEMKALRKELEEKLGDKVVFKKAKYSPKVLSDMVKDVTDYVDTLTAEGKASSVGYNSVEEAIEIEAVLTDEQIYDLNNKFGAHILKITNEEPQEMIGLTK